jgi:hypothetical protein
VKENTLPNCFFATKKYHFQKSPYLREIKQNVIMKCTENFSDIAAVGWLKITTP